jgi:hypothetical protein
LSIKRGPKWTILLKVKLNMTSHLSSIKNDNFSMWSTHNFPTPPGTSADLHNKMDDPISHMTMMVIVPFSMIMMDADAMTTTAMSFLINMITTGR